MQGLIRKSYVVVVAVAAVAVTVTLPRDGIGEDILTLLALVVLALLSGSRAVRVPGLRVQLTAADMFLFCAVSLLAPLAAALVALAGVVGSLFGPERRPLSERTVFNLGAVTLSAAGASLAYGRLIAGEPDTLVAHAPYLVATGVIYLALNLVLVAVAVALENRIRALTVFSATAPRAAVACLASLVLALGLVLAVEAVGPGGLLLGLFGTSPLLAYFREHKRNMAESAA